MTKVLSRLFPSFPWDWIFPNVGSKFRNCIDLNLSRKELDYSLPRKFYIVPLPFYYYKAHMLSLLFHPLNHAQLIATPWTVAHQAPSLHRISQARILEWVAISFSRGSSRPRDRTYVSCLAGGFFFFTTEPPRKHSKFIDRALLKLIVAIY